VVDADCRSHDVPNLYVVDGSVFPSASEKNPTHTIMALAARAAEHIAERMQRGDL
jgi:choline dehydrogenase-like flavoprotein